MGLKSKLYPFDIDENVCGIDRVIRLMLAIALVGLGIFYLEKRLWTVLSFFLAFVLFLNVITTRCKVNEILGLDSCPDQND